MLWGIAAGVVIFSGAVVVVAALGTVEEVMEERVGKREVEEWDTYGTPTKFLSSSSLCLLEGLSTCLPKAVCVFVCVCMPCVCILAPVSETCVPAIVVSD